MYFKVEDWDAVRGTVHDVVCEEGHLTTLAQAWDSFQLKIATSLPTQEFIRSGCNFKSPSTTETHTKSDEISNVFTLEAANAD